MVRQVAARMAEHPPAPAAPTEQLLERTRAFLDELLVDEHLDANQIADAQQLHDDLMATCKKPVASVRAQGVETEASRIAARIFERSSRHPHERKHTRTTLRPLAWPVWVDGKRADCVVSVYYVLAHPRKHETERFWFPSIAEAMAAYPKAQVLDDVPSVKAGRA
jgi:hypothetical protein